MVIISTSAVAAIIHAVSAALMPGVSAKAGVASAAMNVATKNIAAALAAWRGSAPMMFSPARYRSAAP